MVSSKSSDEVSESVAGFKPSTELLSLPEAIVDHVWAPREVDEFTTVPGGKSETSEPDNKMVQFVRSSDQLTIKDLQEWKSLLDDVLAQGGHESAWIKPGCDSYIAVT